MNIQAWHAPFDPSFATDLRRRLGATRLIDHTTDTTDTPGTTGDWRYGTAVQPLQELLAWWQAGYDWDAASERLNALPHFRADIDGFGVHFLHFKGHGPDPQPLLLMNGWPSSFVEYGKLAQWLSDPASHGGDAFDAFDVVIPALPGYGYSDRPAAPGQAAAIELFHRLMTEGLGYQSFIASGTDIGAGLATRMALKYPQSLRGIHVSAQTDPTLAAGAAPLSDGERAYLAGVAQWSDAEGAYSHQQSTRPQTLAIGLNDSPAGLASWILEKFHFWSDSGDSAAELFRVFPKDMLLDNLNLYWATQTIATSFFHYYETRHFRSPLAPGERVSVPTAICIWPKDLVGGCESWARRLYNVRSYTSQAHGGHFPAWEQPALYAADLRAFRRALDQDEEV